MSETIKPYVVRAGEYLTGIALAHGVEPGDIWEHPANDDLRRRRPNPEILAPGDVLFIPIVGRTWLPVQVGQVNRFVATVPTVALCVVLKGRDGAPLAGKAIHLEPRVASVDRTTDGNGVLSIAVPVTVGTLVATVSDPRIAFYLRVGHLDPHDVESGALARLRQLGYVGDESHLFARARPYLAGFHRQTTVLARAVAAFQADKGHAVTGKADDALLADIREAYGS